MSVCRYVTVSLLNYIETAQQIKVIFGIERILCLTLRSFVLSVANTRFLILNYFNNLHKTS